MIVRTLTEVKTVEWGHGLSRRFLLRADGIGYTLTDTLVRAGSRSLLHYRNHFEACYCIAGSGSVIDADGRAYAIEPGTMYALDRHDRHTLVADATADMRLVCVFAPALEGDEAHRLDADTHSSYGEATLVEAGTST